MPARRLPHGRLVVIEGIDGAGKTTQCERLAKTLRADGWDVERLREPTDGPYGKKIRELANSGRNDITPAEELDLFLADRRENVQSNILPALERGAVVLMDRYYYSTIAYQGARGLDPESIRLANESFAPKADLLIYLYIPLDIVGRRIEENRGDTRNLFEKAEYLEKVKAIFDDMRDPQLRRVDGSAPADCVAAEILDLTRDCLAEALGGGQTMT